MFDLNSLVDDMVVEDIHNSFFAWVSPLPDQELAMAWQAPYLFLHLKNLTNAGSVWTRKISDSNSMG